jgi:hypothetical protein
MRETPPELGGETTYFGEGAAKPADAAFAAGRRGATPPAATGAAAGVGSAAARVVEPSGRDADADEAGEPVGAGVALVVPLVVPLVAVPGVVPGVDVGVREGVAVAVAVEVAVGAGDAAEAVAVGDAAISALACAARLGASHPTPSIATSVSAQPARIMRRRCIARPPR